MKEDLLQKLSKPFTEIVNGKEVPAHKWRVMTTKYGTADCVPYITANQVKQRLNEVFGVDGWSDLFIETSQNFLICELSAEIEGKKTTKSDVGTPSDYESNKGMASDALKRAAVSFGIGAYLTDIGVVKLKKSGKNAMTEKGQVLSDPQMLTDYLNAGNPYSSHFRVLFSALSEESQTKYSETFKAIFDELS